MANQRFKSVYVALGSMAMAAPALVALQAPAQAAGCGVWADTPYATPQYDEVDGRGGRSGCTTAKQIRVDLRWDKALSPDPSLDYRSGVYTNVSLLVIGDCLAGTHDYYVDVSGDAGSVASNPRARLSAADCS